MKNLASTPPVPCSHRRQCAPVTLSSHSSPVTKLAAVAALPSSAVGGAGRRSRRGIRQQEEEHPHLVSRRRCEEGDRGWRSRGPPPPWDEEHQRIYFPLGTKSKYTTPPAAAFFLLAPPPQTTRRLRRRPRRRAPSSALHPLSPTPASHPISLPEAPNQAAGQGRLDPPRPPRRVRSRDRGARGRPRLRQEKRTWRPLPSFSASRATTRFLCSDPVKASRRWMRT